MSVNNLEIENIQGIVRELEEVHTKRIRAEAKYDQEMELLGGLGCSSIEEAEKVLKKVEVRIKKREEKLQEAFDDFMDDYSEVLQ